MTVRRVVWVLVWVVVIAGSAYALFSWFTGRPTLVPDLTHLRVDEATVLVGQADLVMGDSTQVATDTVGPGLIVSQSPLPGSQADPGSAVDVTVAVQPEFSLVPDVVGQTAESAAQALTAALYIPRSLEMYSIEGRDGRVLEQYPEAGEQLQTGQSVVLAVSLGPDDGTGVKVPDVMGQTPTEAVDTLNGAGLVAENLVAAGGAGQTPAVKLQVPAAGVTVRPGTVVYLVFNLP